MTHALVKTQSGWVGVAAVEITQTAYPLFAYCYPACLPDYKLNACLARFTHFHTITEEELGINIYFYKKKLYFGKIANFTNFG